MSDTIQVNNNIDTTIQYNNINTIQYNNKNYYRIAAKRDAAAVARTRYEFFYKHWDVLIDGTYYLFVTSTNGVYTLTGTAMTISISNIPKLVYEGIEVPVNALSSTLKTGTLHINSSHFNYACTKSTVEQTSGCSLKLPSLDYESIRLVREEDIIVDSDTVKLYFDEHYIDVECFTKSDIPEYAIVPGWYATGYISRTANDNLNISALHTNSRSYITCHVGDTIKIIAKNKALINVAVRLYTQVGGIFPTISKKDENGNDIGSFNLQKGESVDYIINGNWFVTFNIPYENYNLFGAVLDEPDYCDSCVVKVNDTNFIIAGRTDEAKRSIQLNSRVNITTSLSIYTVDVRTKERDFVWAGEPPYILVDALYENPMYDTNGNEVYVYNEYKGESVLANSQGQIILSDNTLYPLAVQAWYNIIEVTNLTDNTLVGVTQTSGGSHSSARSYYFTMPAADCLLTVTTNIVTDGDTVSISPRYSLTIEVDDNSKSVFPVIVKTGNTTTKCNTSTTIQNVENNYFDASWTEVDGKLYTIIYKSTYSEFDNYSTRTARYSNSLMGNRTLSISLIDPDVIYRNSGEISTIKAGKIYEENNNIISNSNTIMGLNDYPRRTYYANTASPIKTSNTHFKNKEELKKVVFNNVNSTFTVNADAFYNCLKLESVTINGTENIKVKDRAFYNNIMMSEFNDLNKITELGHSCFFGVGLDAYTSSTELRVIPEYAFSESLLSTVNLAGTPINPAKLSTIKDAAFYYCLNLNTVHLPVALTTLGRAVFANTPIPCVHTLPAYTDETVFSPYGAVFNVNSEYKNGLSTLPVNTFAYCKSLKEVHLPSSVTHVERCAFADCNNLEHFAAPGLKTIESGAFFGTWIEDSYNYNKLEHTSGGLAYKEGTSGIYFYFPQEITNPNRHVTLIKPDPETEEYILYKRPTSYPAVGNNFYFNKKIISISDHGFAHNDTINWLNPYNLDFLALSPSTSIEYIGDYAFKGSGFLNCELNWNNVRYLGTGAFLNCRALSSLLGFENAKITVIKPYTFYNCGGDKSGIGNDANYNVDLTFKIPTGITEIGDYAFAKCPQLMGIANLAICPIHTVGKFAFQNCFNNTAWRLKYGGFITSVVAVTVAITALFLFGGHALGCALYGATVPWATTATTNAWLAIEGMTGVICIAGSAGAAHHTRTDFTEKYLNVTENHNLRWMATLHTSNLLMPKLKNIGIGAFKDCHYLGGITISSSTTSIPDYAFLNCTRFSFLYFVDDTYDPTGTLACSIVPGYNLTSIGKYAFKGCKKLELMSIQGLFSRALVSIKKEAFDGVEIYKNEASLGLALSGSIRSIEENALNFEQLPTIVWANWNPTNITLGSNAFGSYDNDLKFVVPKGSKSKFLTLLFLYKNAVIEEIELDDVTWIYLRDKYGFPINWVIGDLILTK